jgi:hypothetical protein
MAVMRRTAHSFAVILALALSACGTESAPPAGPVTNQTQANGTTGVPDACSLLTTARLGELLGIEPGQGQPRSVSPNRSVCFYDNVITAVEIAANYDASRRIIEENGSTTTDIPGVGTGAFFDSNGQVIAKGERFFVGVTASVSKDRMTDAARELLAAAEAA